MIPAILRPSEPERCAFHLCDAPRRAGDRHCEKHIKYLEEYEKKKQRFGLKPMTLEERKLKMEHGLNKKIGRKNATP